MDNNTTKRNQYIAITLLAGFFYRLLISLQGIDHTDLGFSNTFYQNIFTHPDAMPYYFNYYLTGLVGGFWYQLLGFTGVLGFRLLEALVLTASIFFVYKAFERQIHNTRSIVIAVAGSFFFPAIVTTFHYNTLTLFCLSLAAWCYARSLYGRQLLWTYMSGLVLGFCFFVRTGNGALVLLLFIPVVYALATSQRSLIIRLGGTMLGGMLTACAIIFSIMAVLGHLGYFVAGLDEVLGYYSDKGILSSLGMLLAIYLKSYVNILLQMLALVGLGALYLQGSRLNNSWSGPLGILLIIASIVLIATSLPYLSALALYTLLCIPILYAITPKEDKLIAVFVMAGTYIYPFGSENGIASIFHWTAALLIIPAAIGVYHTSRIVRRGVLICSIYIGAVMLWRAIPYTYGEETPRWESTECIGNSMLNTFISQDKAEDYRHILPIINKYKYSSTNIPWLLLGNQAAELYYATETLPFLGTTQLKTFTGAALYRRLEQQSEKHHCLPVVVFLKKQHFITSKTAQVQQQIHQWMVQHNYHVVYDDAYLTVFDI